MDTNTIDLNNINLDGKIMIHLRFVGWCDKYKQRKVF